MYGSNYFGQAYYGQGPAVGTTFILRAISATIIATASIGFQLLINHAVSATVTTTASIRRQFNRITSATAITTASIISTIVEGLNIRRAATKFLNMFRRTNPLDSDNATKQLNLIKTTRIITTDE